MTPSESEEFNKLGIQNAKLYNQVVRLQEALKYYGRIVALVADKTYVPPKHAQLTLEKYKDVHI